MRANLLNLCRHLAVSVQRRHTQYNKKDNILSVPMWIRPMVGPKLYTKCTYGDIKHTVYFPYTSAGQNFNITFQYLLVNGPLPTKPRIRVYSVTGRHCSFYATTGRHSSVYAVTVRYSSVSAVTGGHSIVFAVTCRQGSVYAVTCRHYSSVYAVKGGHSSVFPVTGGCGSVYSVTDGHRSVYAVTGGCSSVFPAVDKRKETRS